MTSAVNVAAAPFEHIIWAAVLLNTLCAYLGGALGPLVYYIRGTSAKQAVQPLYRQFMIYPIPGTVLVFVYSVSNVVIAPIVALNIGITGPAIIGALLDRPRGRPPVTTPPAI